MTALRIEAWPQTVEEFDTLIEATQDELIRFAFFRLGNRADAEDVVQDVYVQAFRERKERRHITKARAYLFRMVGNRCVDVLRHRSRQVEGPLKDELDSGDDLFSSLDVREKAETVSRSLASIPETEAEVICLRAYSELSFADISQALDSPVSTVKSRFRYGIEKLRRLLGEERCIRK